VADALVDVRGLELRLVESGEIAQAEDDLGHAVEADEALLEHLLRAREELVDRALVALLAAHDVGEELAQHVDCSGGGRVASSPLTSFTSAARVLSWDRRSSTARPAAMRSPTGGRGRPSQLAAARRRLTEVTRAWARWVLLRLNASGLLISWATPAVSWPRLASFSLWTSWACEVLSSWRFCLTVVELVVGQRDGRLAGEREGQLERLVVVGDDDVVDVGWR
jgi:hypothetical protein